ncbi:MAG: methyltransferase domain-containing protein [Desulfobacterales bacterium]|nr:methyltransferase domain-containing protein [Desulfobacterales bacterium]
MIRTIIPSRWRFEWRYWRGNTPWDTNITPPEVMEFIAETPPGRALDLGCGTGTNAIALARHGWQATGVDFAPKAVHKARAARLKPAGFKNRFPLRRRQRSRHARRSVRLRPGHRLPVHPAGKRPESGTAANCPGCCARRATTCSTPGCPAPGKEGFGESRPRRSNPSCATHSYEPAWWSVRKRATLPPGTGIGGDDGYCDACPP